VEYYPSVAVLHGDSFSHFKIRGLQEEEQELNWNNGFVQLPILAHPDSCSLYKYVKPEGGARVG
jgi:hypothetical protein